MFLHLNIIISILQKSKPRLKIALEYPQGQDLISPREHCHLCQDGSQQSRKLLFRWGLPSVPPRNRLRPTGPRGVWRSPSKTPSAPPQSSLERWDTEGIDLPFSFGLCGKSEYPLQQPCWQSGLKKERMRDTSDLLLLRSWRERLGYHLIQNVEVGSYSNTSNSGFER